MLDRRLALLGGVGIAALLSQTASADTVFTSFAFSATGGSSNRTMPDRLHDVVNVKDFGAVGDGSTNDTTAIQNAINSAAASGSTGGSAKNGGVVFFPPGAYKVTSSLQNNVSGTNVELRGSGTYSTTIFGSLNNAYIIDSNFGVTLGQFGVISDMFVYNSNAGSNTGVDVSYGTIRFNTPCGQLLNIVFGGTNGIIASSDSFNSAFINCQGSGPGGGSVSGQLGYGSIGIAITQATLIGCSALGYWTGMSLSNAGAVLLGCRTETCHIGVNLGYDPTGVGTSVAAAAVIGHTTERCMTAYKVTVASNTQISGCFSSGTIGPPEVSLVLLLGVLAL